MNKPLAVGVIGAGAISAHHAKIIANLDNARLVAVTDPDSKRASDVATSTGTRAAPDAETLLDHAGIDAVVIAGPVETHVDSIVLAASHGKDILCEKPLAGFIAGCHKAIDACERAGVRLQVGFMRRYDPAYVRAFEAIRAGSIGEPVRILAISRDAAPPSAGYLTSPEAANLLLESAVHDFDIARWFLDDEVVEVSATAGMISCPELKTRMPMDLGVVTLRFQGGAIATIENYKNAGYGYDIRTEVIGTSGALSIGCFPGRDGEFDLFEKPDRRFPQHWLERFDEAYRRQAADWVRRMLDGRPPAVTGLDGLRATVIAEAADWSRFSGRPETPEP